LFLRVVEGQREFSAIVIRHSAGINVNQ
jgi:hypothetical protein